MVVSYSRFNFGDSFFRSKAVTDLIVEKMPVFYFAGSLDHAFTYLISIPLGIKKAVRHGERFDIWTNTMIIIGYAIPKLCLPCFLLFSLLAKFIDLVSASISTNFDELSWGGKIWTIFWHIALPVTALVVGGQR